ncbi:putative multicopper oxidase [Halovivax ruber XH-70]|uniref:Putative multicopper oxidase n=1 Tax=Halovivax ruber (strain DSM 18193 / JCM 13892 / XH-70) TaxID=797302 RepID=L0IAP0_HALRX|nr:multicopper oxidase domain-containing protein [Halovivax ruber]AGB15804.1 putative multicopper oxidase [Halovivax ruber XH-70]
MLDLSRRRLLKAGAALGLVGSVPASSTAMEGDDEGPSYFTSPDVVHENKYVQPLPIPDEREPDGTRKGKEYHELEMLEAEHSFHPDLPDTTIWGFDGQFPGPIIAGRRNDKLAIDFDNSNLPDEHLFTVDENVEGTTTENYHGYDGSVPEVRNSTHVHGLNIDPENDGQADMWKSPGGVTGPRFSNDVQQLPNRQPRLTSMYHDHTRGLTRLNNYAGLVGPYYIRSNKEDKLDLPEGDYDIPLVLADRSFTEDGELHYPKMFMANVAGDVATVNGAAFPSLEVEPRRYRFRLVNVSNGRTYDLGLDNDDPHGHGAPALHQISSGHGFLEEVVEIGHHGDMDSLVVAPFERAEIIVDFSEYAGETFTVTNDATFPYEGPMDHGGGGHDDGGHGGMSSMDMDDGMDHGGDQPPLPEIMQIQVADEVTETDTSTPPTQLDLPSPKRVNPNAAKKTRQVTMQMGMDDEGLMIHTLNNKRWSDPIEFTPQLGSTEIWELKNDDDHTHPIHLHLVAFDVIEREWHNTDEGPRPPLPNERGGKDVVKVNPGETVRIAVEFKNFAGKYPFHCHILEHEEHDMMRMFEVVKGNSGDNGHGSGSDGEGKQGRGHGRGNGRGHGRLR